jgi:hypothetical protein
MSIRSCLLLLPAALLLLLGSASSGALAQHRTTSGTAALDAEGTVVVDNHEGRITVETWDRAEVEYEAVVHPEPDADHPEATVVRVDRSESRVVLRTEYDESKENGDDSGWFGGDGQNVMPVEYTLTVPRGARLEVEDHESEIQVTGLGGPAAVETHDGSIRLTDPGGDTRIESHDGPIRVENATGALTVDTHDGRVALTGQDGDADIESHDGPIRVENQTGALTIETHDSDVRLRSVDGRVRIDAHDSDVEAEGLRGGLEVDTHEGSGRFAFAALTGDVNVRTDDGDFTLVLPAGTGFDLRTEFDDEGATLQADFDLSPYRIGGTDENDEVNYSGSVNGGGPRISLSADEGDFAIRM